MSNGADDTEHEAQARQIAKTALQRRLERMIANPPVRDGKQVTVGGIRRTFRSYQRAAMHRVHIRSLFDDRRKAEDEEYAKQGLTEDERLELDRRRLKRESETCRFEEKGEKMRDPLTVKFKPRKRRTSKDERQRRNKARNLRKAEGKARPSDKRKKKPTKKQKREKAAAKAKDPGDLCRLITVLHECSFPKAISRNVIPPWRQPHDDDHCCSGFLYVPTHTRINRLPTRSQENHAKCHGRAYSSDEDGDGPFGSDQNIRREPYTAELAQQSTSKTPPYWAPALEQKGYPLSIWAQDIEIWCAGTELTLDKQGPAIAQRLGGVARELVREVPVLQLV